MTDKIICPQCHNIVNKSEIRCPRCYKLLLTACNGNCSNCREQGKCQS